MITEDQLEQLYLDWFKAIGYNPACGYNIYTKIYKTLAHGGTIHARN